jgi:hypothetical protein
VDVSNKKDIIYNRQIGSYLKENTVTKVNREFCSIARNNWNWNDDNVNNNW